MNLPINIELVPLICVLAGLAGVRILMAPRLLNHGVAIDLIVTGVLQLLHCSHMTPEGRS
jgi:hypothetical protein